MRTSMTIQNEPTIYCFDRVVDWATMNPPRSINFPRLLRVQGLSTKSSPKPETTTRTSSPPRLPRSISSRNLGTFLEPGRHRPEASGPPIPTKAPPGWSTSASFVTIRSPEVTSCPCTTSGATWTRRTPPSFGCWLKIDPRLIGNQNFVLVHAHVRTYLTTE
jgi:hypothetical protein